MRRFGRLVKDHIWSTFTDTLNPQSVFCPILSKTDAMPHVLHTNLSHLVRGGICVRTRHKAQRLGIKQISYMWFLDFLTGGDPRWWRWADTLIPPSPFKPECTKAAYWAPCCTTCTYTTEQPLSVSTPSSSLLTTQLWLTWSQSVHDQNIAQFFRPTVLYKQYKGGIGGGHCCSTSEPAADHHTIKCEPAVLSVKPTNRGLKRQLASVRKTAKKYLQIQGSTSSRSSLPSEQIVLFV